MKNLILLFSMLLSSQLVFAQMTTWTWDTYKFEFDAPDNFEISKNSEDGFSAANANINLTIYPKKGTALNYKKMLSSLTEWADIQNLDYEEGASYIDGLNGYWGCYIDGVAPNDNSTTVLLLIDPDYPEICLYIWLQYHDDYVNTAVEIIQSFTPN